MKRSLRPIEQLRKEHGGSWMWDGYVWTQDTGRTVRAYAALAPRFDGDDDNFVTEYRWEDTGETAIYCPRRLLRWFPNL